MHNSIKQIIFDIIHNNPIRYCYKDKKDTNKNKNKMVYIKLIFVNNVDSHWYLDKELLLSLNYLSNKVTVSPKDILTDVQSNIYVFMDNNYIDLFEIDFVHDEVVVSNKFSVYDYDMKISDTMIMQRTFNSIKEFLKNQQLLYLLKKSGV